MSRLQITLPLLAALLALAGITAADTLTGEIHGGVLDTETKFGLPEVAVTLTNADQGWQRRARTDSGRY